MSSVRVPTGIDVPYWVVSLFSTRLPSLWQAYLHFRVFISYVSIDLNDIAPVDFFEYNHIVGCCHLGNHKQLKRIHYHWLRSYTLLLPDDFSVDRPPRCIVLDGFGHWTMLYYRVGPTRSGSQLCFPCLIIDLRGTLVTLAEKCLACRRESHALFPLSGLCYRYLKYWNRRFKHTSLLARNRL